MFISVIAALITLDGFKIGGKVDISTVLLLFIRMSTEILILFLMVFMGQSFKMSFIEMRMKHTLLKVCTLRRISCFNSLTHSPPTAKFEDEMFATLFVRNVFMSLFT